MRNFFGIGLTEAFVGTMQLTIYRVVLNSGETRRVRNILQRNSAVNMFSLDPKLRHLLQRLTDEINTPRSSHGATHSASSITDDDEVDDDDEEEEADDGMYASQFAPPQSLKEVRRGQATTARIESSQVHRIRPLNPDARTFSMRQIGLDNGTSMVVRPELSRMTGMPIVLDKEGDDDGDAMSKLVTSTSPAVSIKHTHVRSGSSSASPLAGNEINK